MAHDAACDPQRGNGQPPPPGVDRGLDLDAEAEHSSRTCRSVSVRIEGIGAKSRAGHELQRRRVARAASRATTGEAAGAFNGYARDGLPAWEDGGLRLGEAQLAAPAARWFGRTEARGAGWAHTLAELAIQPLLYRRHRHRRIESNISILHADRLAILRQRPVDGWPCTSTAPHTEDTTTRGTGPRYKPTGRQLLRGSRQPATTTTTPVMKAVVLSTLAVLAGLRPASAANAAFYTWPNSPSTDRSTKPEVLSHLEGRLALASRLGLSQFHQLGTGVNVYKLQNVASTQPRLWTDKQDVDGTVMITVGGVANADGFFDRSPIFEIENMPEVSEVGRLNRRLESEAEKVMATDAKSLYSNSNGGFVDTVSPAHASGIDLNPNINQWDAFESAVGASDASLFKSDQSSDVDFFEEYMVLKAIGEKTIEQVKAEKATIFVHLTSLDSIARKDGIKSQKHKLASKLMAVALKDVFAAASGYPSIVGLVPPTPKNAKRIESSELVGVFESKHRRKEAPLAPSHTPKFAAEPVSSVTPLKKGKKGNKIARPRPGCFESRDVCGNTTNSCNGRGTCMKSSTQSNCWSCACNATVIKVKNKKNKTTYWGGNACQKEDVSTPFLIFVTFAIGMTLAVIWTINQMLDLGGEELPGELSAGVAIVKK
ncbi:hypothetical protein Dda_1266 [Drechslerella dactyloides]|uniref:DUF3844 domain-containing protein n=1 Tax=Drechslerella dactyloides TaxID=74499 RepID=A0AAD6J3T3_DREDA|nr:hypothetical protein Dda_1266 [Drechslerella dactyloides]